MKNCKCRERGNQVSSEGRIQSSRLNWIVIYFESVIDCTETNKMREMLIWTVIILFVCLFLSFCSCNPMVNVCDMDLWCDVNSYKLCYLSRSICAISMVIPMINEWCDLNDEWLCEWLDLIDRKMNCRCP